VIFIKVSRKEVEMDVPLTPSLSLVSRSVNVYDLPTTLSKFLNMGVPLATVIAKATIVPARMINEPHLGVLKPGHPADIACFKLVQEEIVFKDAANNERRGTQRLVNTMTMVDGTILEPAKESPQHPWVVRDLATVAALDEKEECC
jgi:dihydroorotase